MFVDVGQPWRMPPNVDFYTLSNEDVGLIASLVTGTNDTYVYAHPLPASLDIYNETIIIWKMEFFGQGLFGQLSTGTTTRGVSIVASYLDRPFAATFRGDLADAADEAWKSKFAGPMYTGQALTNITATASVEGNQRRIDNNQNIVWHPPRPLDLSVPLYFELFNGSQTVTLATNAVADSNYDVFERYSVRTWFTTRRLTQAEKNARANGTRWMILDS